METRCFHKKLEFQRYPPKDFRTARYEHKSSKKEVSNFSKTPKKIIPGPILGQDRPEKNSAKCLFEAARFRVLDRHRATKPTTAPWNLNGARPLGAPTHPLVTVFTKRPVTGGGRRPGVWYKHIWALLCRQQATKILDPSPMAKNRPFSKFERRALDAAGNFSPPRPRIHLTSSRPSSTFTGLARHEAGWPWVAPISISKAYRRVSCFWSACWIFSVKAQVPPRTAAWTNNPRKANIFPPCSP